MKRLLFICNTPYQILFAYNYYFHRKDIELSIVITDTCNGYQKLCENLRKSRYIYRAYIWKLKDFPKYGKFRQLYAYLWQKILKREIMIPSLDDEETYDELFFANFNIEVTYLRRNLLLRNRALSTFMFEDGFASYSTYYEKTLNELLHPNNKMYSLVRRSIYDLYYAVKCLYVFNPSLMQWKSKPLPVAKVDFVGADNPIFIDELKIIFDIHDNINYPEKYIFFEESYRADGKEINDLQMLEDIANLVGKNNICVKPHPRSQRDVFTAHGFRMNTDFSIPWEVLSLFIPLENKVLMTVASVSVITPRILLGKNYKAIMLYKIASPQESLRLDIIPTYVQACKEYSDDILIPQTQEEMLNAFRRGII